MSAEEYAKETARCVLGAHAEVWDIPPRQGAYDVKIQYSDGRVGAMEVTSLAADGQRQLESLLGRDNFSWPITGKWWWTIHVAEPSELPWLHTHYAEIIQLCESSDVTAPTALPHPPRWLAERLNTLDMLGHRDVPAADGAHVRSVAVLPAGAGGAVDTELRGLRDALAAVLARPHVAKRIAKVVEAAEAEAHLFLVLDITAMPFATGYALAFSDAAPLDPPPLAGLTHLWLAPRFSHRILIWTDGHGWAQHPAEHSRCDRGQQAARA